MFLPFFKLGTLFAKTLVKPVTNGIKEYSKQKPWFSNSCFWLARRYYHTHNGFCRTLKLPQEYYAKKFSHDEAVELGTSLLGEVLVLGSAVGILYYEFIRSSKTPSKCDLLEERIDKRLDYLDKKVELLEKRGN